jgi:hypothetical protein
MVPTMNGGFRFEPGSASAARAPVPAPAARVPSPAPDRSFGRSFSGAMDGPTSAFGSVSVGDIAWSRSRGRSI